MKLRALTRIEDCLPGRANPGPEFPTASSTHLFTRQKILPPYPEGLDVIVFGMGCFWCSEGIFYRKQGVHATLVGYSQGVTQNPTYQEVCSGKTNHAEVVKVVYDKRIIDTNVLLKEFWEHHDFTSLYQQGNDEGTQYRSGIYYTTEEQKTAALKSAEIAKQLLKTKTNKDVTVVTEIEPVKNFFPAEELHQQYDMKPGSRQYCGLRPLGIRIPINK